LCELRNSDDVFPLVQPWMIPAISSRRSRRAAPVAKPGWRTRSGRPMARRSASTPRCSPPRRRPRGRPRRDTRRSSERWAAHHPIVVSAC